MSAARVHEQLRRSVIEQIGFARFDKRQLVHNAGRVRQDITDPCTTVAMLSELSTSSQEIGSMAAVHERKPFAFQKTLRHRFAAQLIQHGLVIEHIQLRGPARHKQKDHPLRPRWKRWCLCSHRS